MFYHFLSRQHRRIGGISCLSDQESSRPDASLISDKGLENVSEFSFPSCTLTAKKRLWSEAGVRGASAKTLSSCIFSLVAIRATRTMMTSSVAISEGGGGGWKLSMVIVARSRDRLEELESRHSVAATVIAVDLTRPEAPAEVYQAVRSALSRADMRRLPRRLDYPSSSPRSAAASKSASTSATATIVSKFSWCWGSNSVCGPSLNE